MQNFVVLEIVEQGEGSAVAISRHVNAGAGDTRDLLAGEIGKEKIERHAHFAEMAAKNAASFSPRQHEEENRGGNEKREPAAVRDL